jgi:hypothetical protein
MDRGSVGDTSPTRGWDVYGVHSVEDINRVLFGIRDTTEETKRSPSWG